MKALLENTYERFLQVVSGGRKMPLKQVRKLAEGRVYTGLEAHKIGLVDEIGGIEIAKAQLAKRIGVRRIKTIEYSMKENNNYQTYTAVYVSWNQSFTTRTNHTNI